MPVSYAGRKTTHFVGINRAKHKNLALNPCRKTFLLYQAIEKVGLTYEREVEFDAGDYPIWFNARVELAGGKFGIIFLKDYYGNYNYRVRQRKLTYIQAHPELPVLECWQGSTDYIAAQISLWLATIGIRPQKICEGNPPKRGMKHLQGHPKWVEE